MSHLALQPYMIKVGYEDTERLDALSALYNRLSMDWCEKHEVFAKKSFLDVGCGNGGFTTLFAKSHPHISCVGIDISAEQLHVAQDKASEKGLSNIQWTQKDVYELDDLKELYPGLFDVVHSRFVLTHLNRPTEAIDAMLSMLKPGGLILLEEFGPGRKFEVNHKSSKRAFEAFAEIVKFQAERQQSHKMDPETVRNHLEGRVSDLKIELLEAVADQTLTKKTFLLGAAQGVAKLAEFNESHRLQNCGYEDGEAFLQEMKKFVEDNSQTVTIKNLTFVMAKLPLE